MMQKEKLLVFQDLSARLPYEVIVQEPDYYEAPLSIVTLSEVFYDGLDIKPYLRSMSSMTDEEKEVFEDIKYKAVSTHYSEIDWLNAHHFDYRGLIEKGLALEAPKDMYK